MVDTTRCKYFEEALDSKKKRREDKGLLDKKRSIRKVNHSSPMNSDDAGIEGYFGIPLYTVGTIPAFL